MDLVNGELLFLQDELRVNMDRPIDVQDFISYLSRVIVEVSRLWKGTAR